MDGSWELCRVCWAREVTALVDDIQVCQVCESRLQPVTSDGEADVILFPPDGGDFEEEHA
jgi:hypothetical protein